HEGGWPRNCDCACSSLKVADGRMSTSGQRLGRPQRLDEEFLNRKRVTVVACAPTSNALQWPADRRLRPPRHAIIKFETLHTAMNRRRNPRPRCTGDIVEIRP